MQKFKKKVIAHYEKYIDGEQFEVFVVDEAKQCSDGDKYYNVHIISEKYQSDELNTLTLQEPHSCIENPKEYFDRRYMIGALMEHFIWDRFYDEGILSTSVKVHEIDEH